MTDDSICTSLGLSSFRCGFDVNQFIGGLRLLLKPSFHPQSVVSLVQSTRGATLEIRAFSDQLSSQPSLALIPTAEIETVSVHTDDVLRFAQLFADTVLACPDFGDPMKAFMIDGMPISILAKSDALGIDVAGNATASAFAPPCNELLTWAVERLSGDLGKRVLMAQRSYVSSDVPFQRWPSHSTAGLLVLGVDPDRDELIQALRRPRRVAIDEASGTE